MYELVGFSCESVVKNCSISTCLISSPLYFRFVFCARHDNQTGRWLTPFRATWDPKFDSYAVVGSMRQPRQVGMCLVFYSNHCYLQNLNQRTEVET